MKIVPFYDKWLVEDPKLGIELHRADSYQEARDWLDAEKLAFACEKKKSFATLKSAVRRAKKIRSLGSAGAKLTPYPCPECRMWHLTAQSRTNGQLTMNQAQKLAQTTPETENWFDSMLAKNAIKPTAVHR